MPVINARSFRQVIERMGLAVLLCFLVGGCKEQAAPPDRGSRNSATTQSEAETWLLHGTTQPYAATSEENLLVSQVEAMSAPVTLKALDEEGNTIIHIAARDGQIAEALLGKESRMNKVNGSCCSGSSDWAISEANRSNCFCVTPKHGHSRREQTAPATAD